MSDHAAEVSALPQPEHGIESDDLNTTMIVAVGLISTALLLASVLGVTALVDSFQAIEVNQKVNDTPYSDANEVFRQQRLKLNETAADPTNPEVHTIPISEAKRLVVQELRAARKADPN